MPSLGTLSGRHIDLSFLRFPPPTSAVAPTRQMYIQSRNYMVRSYQRMLEADADGQAFLTGTECRRKLAGDACSILRCVQSVGRRYFGKSEGEAGQAGGAGHKIPDTKFRRRGGGSW